MGEVVGAGLLAHVPTIMLPESERRELNHGRGHVAGRGAGRLRAEVFDRLDYDTVVVLDSHWATTVEYVVSAQDRRAGCSPRRNCPGACAGSRTTIPATRSWRRAMAARADDHGTWITAIDDPYLPVMYATINLWHYLGAGWPDKRWVSVSTCQTGDTEDHLRAGRALGAAIAATDRKVVLIASGALSHTFWPLRELREHEAAGAEHIFTPAACQADRERIGWFGKGDHAQVLDTMPEFLRFRPEARFAHYLMMAGALGEGGCTAAAEPYSDYENSVGTGQIHSGSPAGRRAGEQPAR